MRYNPPPNWPKPPKGWVPHPDWSPDPSWPPPPQGWRLWIDEDDPDAPAAKPALDRLKQAGDDGEYFGDEIAWAEDSGPAPADEEFDGAAPPEADRGRARRSCGRITSGATPRSNGMTISYDIGKIVAIICRRGGDQREARRHRSAGFLSARGST